MNSLSMDYTDLRRRGRKRHSNGRIALLYAAMFLGAMSADPAGAQIQTTYLRNGYQATSVQLGAPFAGAIAQDPTNANKVFVSVGVFGAQSILAANTLAGTTTTVATGFGNIGGIAALANGDLAITENFSSQTIIRARDLTADGDFLDAGEITVLIGPNPPGGFTGSQVAIAPAGNAAGIPAGALVVQTADGTTASKLLVVDSPTTTPVYRPVSGAFFTGFQFNGGVAFSNTGHVIMGEGKFNFLNFTSSGNVHALVNSNANQTIDSGESNILVGEATLDLGLADVAVSKENEVFLTENSGDVRAFPLPGNLLTGTGAPTLFMRTNSPYLSTVRFDDPAKTFAPAATGSTARLYVSGYAPGFAQATNLLIVKPAPLTAAQDWEMYQ
ncbi:MAG: hypothetical protein K1X53_02715 [Candidatus Sumerlaeaceae bacterium]|nr:hypothetical protein [Candidatus Sumerlaeaceae bacterium]